MKKLKAALVGAGNRGTRYTDVMAEMPEKYEVVAVAEPIEKRREYIRIKHNIPEKMCFKDYSELFGQGKIADVLIIATMDKQHFEPVMKAIDLGYDILLEKPVSPDPYECKKISQHAKEANVKIVVCHVLRYSDMFTALKELIDSKVIGEIMSVNHEECVGNVHQTHSFVRGNWGNSDRSSCMLLQKSCHDIDILQWIIGKKCIKIQSFGSLNYFRRENAPKGCADYCVEGCKYGDICPYNAIKIYYDDKENDWFRTTATKMPDPTDEDVMRAITNTQYGKCVFKCDNNVVDHQTVNMLFEDNVTAVFTMNAFNKGGRFIHVMGTKGEIRAAMDEASPISVYDFETKETKAVEVLSKDGIDGGHGGGDTGIINAFYDYITGAYKGNAISDIAVSCENHLTVFAAEKSRLSGGETVDIKEYISEI